MTSRPIALEYLTFLGMPAVRFIELAAAAGFDAVGLRLHPADAREQVDDLRVGTSAHREVVSALQDVGVAVLDIEVFPVAADTDIRVLEPLLEAGALLGARFINIVADDPDLDRLTDTLSALSSLAAQYALRPALEPMAWKTVRDLRTAAQIAQAAGALVQLDALHLHRAGDDVAVVRGIDPSLWSYVQLSDAPSTPPSREPLHLRDEGRFARLIPGQGSLPVAELVEALPPHLLWAAEVPSLEERSRLGDSVYASVLHSAVAGLAA